MGPPIGIHLDVKTRLKDLVSPSVYFSAHSVPHLGSLSLKAPHCALSSSSTRPTPLCPPASCPGLQLSHTCGPLCLQAVHWQGQHLYGTDPLLPKRCPPLPSGKVVLEGRAARPLPSGDHVLCQHGLPDQCQLSGLGPTPRCRYVDSQWDSVHSLPLPTVLKKQHGDGRLTASFLPSD